jgi:hypothetical protein
MAGVVSGGGVIKSETHEARIIVGPPTAGDGELGGKQVRVGAQPLGETAPPAPAAPAAPAATP